MVEGISQKMEGNSVCFKTVVYFMISFRQLCIVTVSLPLCALLICFVTAYIFQQDDIHETHCRCYWWWQTLLLWLHMATIVCVDLIVCVLYVLWRYAPRLIWYCLCVPGSWCLFLVIALPEACWFSVVMTAKYSRYLQRVKVYNVIPSISAITGVSPQRYLWRVCVAFHIGPRIIIASMYHTYYQSLLSSQSPGATHSGSRSCRLLNVTYWLSLLEISALCGVTYISNRENYPVHEKIFMVFMFGSLSYMLATIKVFKLVKPNMNDAERNSYLIKKCLFATSVVSTIGLCVFFLKHRLLCHDMAFSWFSFCEYLIASANMAFHMTVVLDFPTEQLIVAQESPGMVLIGSSAASQQQEHHNKPE